MARVAPAHDHRPAAGDAGDVVAVEQADDGQRRWWGRGCWPACVPSTSLAGGIGRRVGGGRGGGAGRRSRGRRGRRPGGRRRPPPRAGWRTAARSTATVAMPASAAADRLSRAKVWQRGLSPTTTVARQGARSSARSTSARMAAIISPAGRPRPCSDRQGAARAGRGRRRRGRRCGRCRPGRTTAQSRTRMPWPARRWRRSPAGGDEDPRGVGRRRRVAVAAGGGSARSARRRGDGRPPGREVGPVEEVGDEGAGQAAHRPQGLAAAEAVGERRRSGAMT